MGVLDPEKLKRNAIVTAYYSQLVDSGLNSFQANAAAKALRNVLETGWLSDELVMKIYGIKLKDGDEMATKVKGGRNTVILPDPDDSTIAVAFSESAQAVLSAVNAGDSPWMQLRWQKIYVKSKDETRRSGTIEIPVWFNSVITVPSPRSRPATKIQAVVWMGLVCKMSKTGVTFNIPAAVETREDDRLYLKIQNPIELGFWEHEEIQEITAHQDKLEEFIKELLVSVVDVITVEGELDGFPTQYDRLNHVAMKFWQRYEPNIDFHKSAVKQAVKGSQSVSEKSGMKAVV